MTKTTLGNDITSLLKTVYILFQGTRIVARDFTIEHLAFNMSIVVQIHLPGTVISNLVNETS